MGSIFAAVICAILIFLVVKLVIGIANFVVWGLFILSVLFVIFSGLEFGTALAAGIFLGVFIPIITMPLWPYTNLMEGATKEKEYVQSEMLEKINERILTLEGKLALTEPKNESL
jgi:hypothetical protein